MCIREFFEVDQEHHINKYHLSSFTGLGFVMVNL